MEVEIAEREDTAAAQFKFMLAAEEDGECIHAGVETEEVTQFVAREEAVFCLAAAESTRASGSAM